MHRSLLAVPPEAIGGHGIWLTERGGREILDASGGAAVSCLGHQHPRIIDAIQSQVGKLAYAHTDFFTTEPAEALGEELLGHKPGGLEKAFLVCGGSEAMEASIKLARQYFVEIGQPERTHFISRRQSYHGNTLGVLNVGGHPARREYHLPLFSDSFSQVSPAYYFRYQYPDENEQDYCRRLLLELEDEFQKIGPGKVAAFVSETIVGATSGCVCAPKGYFSGVRNICDRYGALLILDEVMCGMGRSGTVHAWEQENVTPDIQAVAKGLGGGYQPIGAMLASGRIVSAIAAGSGAFRHGHTYMAHPVACSAALAVQRTIREENILEHAVRMGSLLESQLKETFANHPNVGDIRGRGLFWGIELVADRGDNVPFNADFRVGRRVKQQAFNYGLACYAGEGTIDGRSGSHILFAPPYIISPEEIGVLIERFARALDSVTSKISAWT